MRRLKLTLSFDGTNYVGWQVQPNGISIQGVLQGAFKKIVGHAVDITAAGRTDAGVHAIAQTAHVSVGCDIPVEGIGKAVNASLPSDIAVTGVAEVDESFHAMRDAKGKIYRYLLSLSNVRLPLFHDRSWHLRENIDVGAMKEAAGVLVGNHDFESFRAAKCSSVDAKKSLYRIDIAEEAYVEAAGNRVIAMTYEGDAFVRHMIRNLTGTIVEAGKGRFTTDDVKDILSQKNRQAAGICAPACGLYLVRVLY